METMLIFLRGLIMGAAEVVPGVSGGTIAFVTGIYERLILALRNFSPDLLTQWRQLGLVGVWQRVDGNFLASLAFGMGVGVLLLSGLVSYLMINHPVSLWSFFFGLIIASSLVVCRQVGSWRSTVGLALGTGLALGLAITYITPVHLNPTLPGLFLGGSIAVCAWILPGLSGSFMLLLLGLYGPALHAVESLDLTRLAALASGCAVGLLLFARLLEYLFRTLRDVVLACLTGFMLGSLSAVWPWKQTISYQIGRHGEQIPVIQEPVLPATWSQLHGLDADIPSALVFMLLGAGLVMSLEWLVGNGFRRVRV